MRLSGLCLGVLLLAWPSLAQASPEDLFGWGPRSPAMGGTGTASSSGADATYTNPALLSRVHHNLLTLGFQGAEFDLHADGPGLPGRISTLPARGFVVGAEVPIPFGGILKDRIAAGMAFYTPSDALVRGRILYPETPEYALLADRAQSLAVRLGLGADIGWGIRVGAGFAALAQLVGSIVVVNTAGSVGARVDDQLVATYAPTFGAAWDLPFDRADDGTRRWRVGLTWGGSIDARFGVLVDASKLSTLNLPVFNIAGIAQYDPQQLLFEVAREWDGWTAAAGVTWKNWSAYPGVLEPTILCPAGQECSLLSPPAIKFSDTLVPRAGLERAIELPRHASIKLRGGFFLEPTPVPSTLPSSQAYDATKKELVDVPTRFFDTTRYVFSLGAGVDFGDYLPFTLDFWAQYHVLASTTATTDPAPAASLSGDVLAYGLMLGVRF